ncbi:MAG: hypothetical protein J0H29_02875 [Sphingobacteriales bacterium]|nr:hypothetical protein [Sphingobacteriales bacterium]
MKTRIIGMLCIVAWAVSSCGKESSREQEEPVVKDTTETSNTKLLTRIVEYEKDYPGDSIITDFYYNANNKLIRTKEHTIATPGSDLGDEDDEYLIYRDASDVVKRVTIMTSHYEDGIFTHKDSSVYDVVYDTGSKHYKYSINTNNFEDIGTPYFIRDSLVYTYNNKDQITMLQILRKDTATGIYFEAERREHDFDAKGNIIKLRTNENYDNQGDPLNEYVLTYDDKINPMNFGMEGFILGMYSFSWPTPNNYMTLSGNEPAAYSYTYDADNYPVLMESSFQYYSGKIYYYYNK